MILPQLLFEIDPDMQARILTGGARRVGALILDNKTGRILRHVQETGLAQQLLQVGGGAILNPLGAATSIVSAVSTYQQNAAILRGVELLKSLQFTNLALGGVALGVGLIGHAMTVTRINRLTMAVERLQDQLNRVEGKIDALLDLPFKDALLNLKTQSQRVDDAWSTAAPEKEWSAALDPIYILQFDFQARAAEALANDRIDRAEVALEAMALAGGLLVTIRTAMNDLKAAQAAALRLSDELSSLSVKVGPERLRPKFTAADSPSFRLQALEIGRAAVLERLAGFRDREERLSQVPPILQSLSHQGVHGRDWLAQLREETSSPYVLVAHTTSV